MDDFGSAPAWAPPSKAQCVSVMLAIVLLAVSAAALTVGIVGAPSATALTLWNAALTAALFVLTLAAMGMAWWTITRERAARRYFDWLKAQHEKDVEAREAELVGLRGEVAMAADTEKRLRDAHAAGSFLSTAIDPARSWVTPEGALRLTIRVRNLAPWLLAGECPTLAAVTVGGFPTETAPEVAYESPSHAGMSVAPHGGELALCVRSNLGRAPTQAWVRCDVAGLSIGKAALPPVSSMVLVHAGPEMLSALPDCFAGMRDARTM